MSYIKNLLLQSLLFLIILLTLLPTINPVVAAEISIPGQRPPPRICQLYSIPEPLTATLSTDGNYYIAARSVTFILHVNSGYKYDVYFQRGILGAEVSFKNLEPNTSEDIVWRWNSSSGGLALRRAGKHPFEVIRQGAPGNYCSGIQYEIYKLEEVQQVACEIQGPKEANIETEIKLTGNVTPQGNYRFTVNRSTTEKKEGGEFNPTSDGAIPEQNLGVLNKGVWQVVLQKKIPRYIQELQQYQDFWENVQSCRLNSISVFSKEEKPNPKTTPVQIGTGQPAGATLPPGTVPSATPCTDPTKCATAGGKPCGTPQDPAIATAIGCVHTSPIGFTEDILKFAVAISGGIAFLMMLMGAFQMLTSAGNPETLKSGQDRLTSAIVGLLIVILAVILLRFIGVDILGILPK